MEPTRRHERYLSPSARGSFGALGGPKLQRTRSRMAAPQDPVLRVLNEVVRTGTVRETLAEALQRVSQQLRATAAVMAWEVVPLDTFKGGLPASIRSCWIFVIRGGAATGAERHPNSHQRSMSLIGNGTFELRDGTEWCAHALSTFESESVEQRWVSIPPSTWHRLFVGPEPWGMVSFHTVTPEELIEERPVDSADLDGETHQERYAGRR
jgi:hypothetical protein